ncbi:hypothetical protein V8E36_006358 [Tilletia maclaganii]
MTSRRPIIISSSPPPPYPITNPDSPIIISSSPPRSVVANSGSSIAVVNNADVGHAQPAAAPASSSPSPRLNPPSRGARSGILRLPYSSSPVTPPRPGHRATDPVSPLASRSGGSSTQVLRAGVIQRVHRPAAASPIQLHRRDRGPGFHPRPPLSVLPGASSLNPAASESLHATADTAPDDVIQPRRSALGPIRTSGGTGASIPGPPPTYSSPASPCSPTASSPEFSIIDGPVNPAPGRRDLAPPENTAARPSVWNATPSTPQGSPASPLRPEQLTPADCEPMDVDEVAGMDGLEIDEDADAWEEQSAPSDRVAPTSAYQAEDSDEELDLHQEEEYWPEDVFIDIDDDHKQDGDSDDDADMAAEAGSVFGSDEAEEHDSPPVEPSSPVSSTEDGDDVNGEEAEEEEASVDGSVHDSDIEFEKADAERSSSPVSSDGSVEEDGDIFLTQHSTASDGNDARRDHLRAWNQPNGAWHPEGADSPTPSPPSSPLTPLPSADSMRSASASSSGTSSSSLSSVSDEPEDGPADEEPKVICIWMQDDRPNRPPGHRIVHRALEPRERFHGLVFRRLSDGEIQAKHPYGWIYAHQLRLAAPADPPQCDGCIE